MKIAVALVALALLAPLPARAATDDAPDRTHSGKVAVSKNPDLPPAYGPNPAKVVVVVMSDFQCPVCRRITDATHQLPEEFPGEVRVEFLNLPLAIHQYSEDAAVAALAAHRQGKFWEMHDLLFAHQDALDADSIARYAQQAKLDVARWKKDVADPAVRKRVKAEAALATSLGGNATPAFLINGKPSIGWGSWMAFRFQVEQELAAAKAMVEKGTKPADVHAARARVNLPSDVTFNAYKAGVIDPLAKAATPTTKKK